MEPAREGGSIIFPILAMNSRDSTQAKLAAFITVTSDFYADLGRYYRARTDAWIEEGSTGEIPMRVEPSKLARLVIAYHEKFGGHVPESALRLLAAGDLAPILQESLATGAPLSETGWGTPMFVVQPRCAVDNNSSGP